MMRQVLENNTIHGIPSVPIFLPYTLQVEKSVFQYLTCVTVNRVASNKRHVLLNENKHEATDYQYQLARERIVGD